MKMKRLLLLVLNEFIKILLRPRSKVFILIIISIVLVSLIIQLKDRNQVEESNWKEDLQIQIAIDSQEILTLKVEGAPESYLSMVQNEIQLNQYHLEKNMSPYQYGVWNFIQGNSFLFLLIMIFSIVISSDAVSREYSTGTIKLLVIRPFSRWKILLSKYIAVTFFSTVMIFIYLFSSFIIGLVFFGEINSYNLEIPTIGDEDNIITYTIGSSLIKSIVLQFIQLMMFITISFVISTIFKNSTIALSVSLASFFGGSIIANLGEKFILLKYTLFTHLNITKFANTENLLYSSAFRESIIVLGIYWTVMMAFSIIVFQRKDIKT